MEFKYLREKYPTFIYNDFFINESENKIEITYNFEIEGLSKFNPKWIFTKKNKNNLSSIRQFKECVFSLGMVEVISYWKLVCCKELIVKCSYLDKYQINWWKKLYFNGLGEFFYINNIKTDIDSFMDIKTSDFKINGEESNLQYSGNLIPVGGGKDSFVTLEVLKDKFEINDAYVINDVKSAINSSIQAGYKNKLINPKRILDTRLLELNKQGYLNGHTPFSAIVAFSSVLCSMIYNKKYICLSNEASANESTVLNEEINHQYSKSYEFEKDFNEYISKYITKDIKYFSILRVLNELDITYIFSKLKKFHKVFRSCNVGSKQGVWCNKCAKCLFVYVMLSAYLTDEELYNIFEENLLEKEELYDLLKELSGISENKPFECVGTRDEVNHAITKAIKNRKHIPILYKKYMNDTKIELDCYNVFDYFNEENFLPKEHMNIIKLKIEEYKNA